MDNIETKVRDIIDKSVKLTKPIDLVGCEEDLMEIGINSYSAIRIIVEIEHEFDFEFDEEGLNFENIQQIQSLVNYIKSKV